MIDNWIANLKKGECIPETELKRLCSMVSVGDITGQWHDNA